MAKKNKTSRYRKYRDGLWLPSRYSLYLWWFRFLRLAAEEGRPVDWSRYAGWDGPNQVLTQDFRRWWEHHWKKLFAVSDPKDKAQFEVSNRKARAEAIRIAYLVYQHRKTGTKEQVYVVLQRKYKNLGSLNANKALETKYVNQHMTRYMKRAEKLLDAVCLGTFG